MPVTVGAGGVVQNSAVLADIISVSFAPKESVQTDKRKAINAKNARKISIPMEFTLLKSFPTSQPLPISVYDFWVY
mgnify:CR=1 FL=1